MIKQRKKSRLYFLFLNQFQQSTHYKSIQTKMFSKCEWDSTFTAAELLNYKKLSLLQLQDACQDFEAESRILDMFTQDILKEIAEEKELGQQLQYQIDQQRQIQQTLEEKYQELFDNRPQTIIGDIEAKIQKNLQISSDIQNTLESLDGDISIAKIQRTQKLEELCLKQSELDAIELKTSQVQHQIQIKKKQIMEIENAMKKSSIQQQDMYNLKKKLNNDLQQYKGNIRVYCRVRPSHSKESILSITSDNTLKLTLSKENIIQGQEKYDQNFFFEQIFGQNDTQNRVFSQISQLVQSSIDGKNVCIFAYGQTGSGKTYTLLGPQFQHNQSISNHDQRGLTPRSIDLIFEEIALSESFKWKYTVYLSIQEIYLDTIIDLIAKCPTSMDKIKQVMVFSAPEVETHLKDAKLNRKTSSTGMNERSSRSHLIVTLRLEGTNQVSNQVRNGSLVLVDLAGSQRIKQSKVQGEGLKETQFINKSLSALGTVINGIRKKSQHISFRNSKLTHVLQRYLEGDSKTLMFINVSPDIEDAFQTKISLSFAESVRECKFNNKK